MKIGVIIDSFRQDFETSVKKAKALGADGIQIGARFLTGRIDEMAGGSKSEKVVSLPEAKKIIADTGIEVSAICGDIGCDMFYTEDRTLIDIEKSLLDMALELGTNIVTTHIGVVPETKNCVQYESMHRVCYELAQYAKSMNGHFAVETGPEKSPLLRDFLNDLGSDGVAVNLDPANLVMCAADDPVEAVYNLKDYIVHTHAKDGLQFKPFDTRRAYSPRYYGYERLNCQGYFDETPFGEGGVDWDRYIAALRDIGYDGYLTVEREVGAIPEENIKIAIDFLQKYV